MIDLFPIPEREKSRYQIKLLSKAFNDLSFSLRRGLEIETQFHNWLTRLTGTSTSAEQIIAIESMRDAIRTEHRKKLLILAPDDLIAYAEYMNEEEPPAMHHRWLCEKLMAMEAGFIPRMLISMPPGSAKSTYASRMFPSWYMGRNPTHKFIQAGHSQSFADSQFGKKVRDMVDTENFRDVFPDVKLALDNKSQGQWGFSNGKGEYLSRGVGAGIAGFRSNFTGVDDPIASKEDSLSSVIQEKIFNWFMADLQTRSLPNAPIAVTMTRWSSFDLIGRLEELSNSGVGIPYEIINIPALAKEDDILNRKEGDHLWPEFYDLPHYQNLKATLPASDWNSLYQGEPMDAAGGVMEADWIKRYKRLPTREDKDDDLKIRRITLSVDTAIKAQDRHDYTALTIWIETKSRQHYLAHVERKKVEFTEMCALIDTVARKWHVDQILVEDKGSGTQYIQLKGTNSIAPIIPISVNNQSKEFRFDAVTPMFASGSVLMPETAAWLADYEKELLGFPFAQYDDMVDSTSQYLYWARRGIKRGMKKMKAGA